MNKKDWRNELTIALSGENLQASLLQLDEVETAKRMIKSCSTGSWSGRYSQRSLKLLLLAAASSLSRWSGRGRWPLPCIVARWLYAGLLSHCWRRAPVGWCNQSSGTAARRQLAHTTQGVDDAHTAPQATVASTTFRQPYLDFKPTTERRQTAWSSKLPLVHTIISITSAAMMLYWSPL